MKLLLILMLPLLSSGSSQQVTWGRSRIVCYYTNWSIYRTNGGSFTAHDVRRHMCTHLVYAFGKLVPEESAIVPSDEYSDITKNGYKDFVGLKTKFNDGIKGLLALGGTYEGASHFSQTSATPEKRKTFAQNAAQYLRKYGFDGLNIDWQFPNDKARNGSAADFNNFVLLLKDIDEEFTQESTKSGKAKLLSTISVASNSLTIDDGYDLPNIQKYVDFMNVLCYDYHFAFDPTTNHHSQLYPLPGEEAGSGHENEGLNAEATIDHILAKGIDPEKLNLGIPLYGRTFTLADPKHHELGADSTGQGAQGPATKEDGYVAYYEVCRNLKNGWTVVHHNKTAMGPYAYKGTQWVGYEDEGSVRRKGEFAKKKGLGGLSFWSMDQDDFKKFCGQQTFPLIRAGREGFRKTQGPEAPPPTQSFKVKAP